MLCFALRRLIDDVYRGPYEISCDATFFEDIQSGVGALVRPRAQGALPSRFSRGMMYTRETPSRLPPRKP